MSDKQSYTITRLGDVAREVREAEQNPLDNGLERLIGLEHIEPENLHIKEWGSIADGTSFTRVFRKGQVLFGKRRAYQRKVALAEFDGICSSDIIVMEAIEDKLVSELLPFIVQSEGFFEHALSTSAGSLSPRTKWKHLAEYKFPLPPKDEQRRIAEILWAADDLKAKYEKLILEVEKTKKVILFNLLTQGINSSKQKLSEFGKIPNHWDVVAFYKVANPKIKYSFTGGPFGSDLKANSYTTEGVRIIQLQNIGDGEFLNEYKIFTSSEKADELFKCNIFPGEIIIAKMADPLARACIIPDYDDRYLMASDGIRLVVDESKFDKYFVLFTINSRNFRNRALGKATGSTRLRIGLTELRNLPFPNPPIEEQREISKIIKSFNETIGNIVTQHKKTQHILCSLRDKFLSG